MKRSANNSELDWPEIDNNVNLSGRPLDYLKYRFKAVIKREMDILLKIKSKEHDPTNEFLKEDLGVPAGSMKQGLLFSQKVFLIGASIRSQALQHFSQNIGN
jgi:hypothetical protein